MGSRTYAAFLFVTTGAVAVVVGFEQLVSTASAVFNAAIRIIRPTIIAIAAPARP